MQREIKALELTAFQQSSILYFYEGFSEENETITNAVKLNRLEQLSQAELKELSTALDTETLHFTNPVEEDSYTSDEIADIIKYQDCIINLSSKVNKYLRQAYSSSISDISKIESNVKEYFLNDKETTSYIILEQKDNYSLLKRFTKESNNDPTPYIVADCVHITNDKNIEWDYGYYCPSLNNAVECFNEHTCNLNENSHNIEIDGHRGTWYVIDSKEYNKEKLFLLEHEEYGDEAPCLIIDSDKNIKLDNVFNGFDDYEEHLDYLSDEIIYPQQNRGR